MIQSDRKYLHLNQLLNWLVTVGSVCLCLLVMPMRLPGIELLGIAPNWLLIWVVVWSLKRSAFQGAIAGLVLGLLQDAMTSPYPTHTLSLSLVGILTARLRQQRYLQENLISVALIVFAMVMLAEIIITLQYVWLISKFTLSNLADIWRSHQHTALAAAIVSSLWAPAVYYPLNRWWQKMT